MTSYNNNVVIVIMEWVTKVLFASKRLYKQVSKVSEDRDMTGHVISQTWAYEKIDGRNDELSLLNVS